LYNLSGSRHIRDALIKFGVKDSTSILLAWFEGGKEGDEENGDVSDLIKGSVADLGDLHLGLDQSQVVDWYKIHDKELTNASLTDCVVFRIGAKDFLDKKQK